MTTFCEGDIVYYDDFDARWYGVIQRVTIGPPVKIWAHWKTTIERAKEAAINDTNLYFVWADNLHLATKKSWREVYGAIN